ncbi:uncharacterized protein B0I36DRAFT_366904 [Microdochium trichocladiopsis]|uniref:Uncharacterized protein n=1 Tax=Microdochium trichocladiopsis TaxID=1682393 RepID=A0A9P8XY85_9PEZI|nr:uncharacterized protein B0I36DRAFT_366904 [Microdochium trichocladiopsis]KAH7025006.1 hypothetical protein B0I36DRAFT_366904 [Microdochium trichocladiopsis]
MNFTNVHEAISHAGDLRFGQTTRETTSRALTLDFSESPDDESVPVDNTITVLRQLYAHVLRHPVDFPSVSHTYWYTPEEASCVLLRFLWADFSRTDDIAEAAHARIKQVVVQQLQPEQLTVAGLLDTPLLQTTLWRRPEFALFHRTCFCRSGGDGPRNEGVWQMIPSDRSPHETVYYDGSDELGAVLSCHFQPLMQPLWGILVQYFFGQPVAISVRYHVTQPRSFTELQAVDFTGKTLGPPQGPAMPPQVWVRQFDYRLVAVVRCGDGGEVKDSVRLYSLGGEPVWRDAETWSIGDTPDADYLLFYAVALEGVAQG